MLTVAHGCQLSNKLDLAAYRRTLSVQRCVSETLLSLRPNFTLVVCFVDRNTSLYRTASTEVLVNLLATELHRHVRSFSLKRGMVDTTADLWAYADSPRRHGDRREDCCGWKSG